MNLAVKSIESFGESELQEPSGDVVENAVIETWARHAAARSGFGAPEATMPADDQAGGAGTNM